MSKHQPTVRALEREMEAAQLLRDHLADVAGDDADLIRDMIEGETSIHELLEAAVEQLARDEASVIGIEAFAEKQADRKARLKRRQETFRVAIRTAMSVAEIPSLEFPLATVSRKALPRQLVTTDEAAIPADYWKPQAPKLDRNALKAALKTGTRIEGAELSNGGETLEVRFR